ncbi:hypothetical protein [Micromonospora sp. CA-111912]|uniref:hypothetical protein n=1 Tax=Micromonospora sp. CA-111912 TaxID=3239955 RepID=UPI003D92B7B8
MTQPPLLTLLTERETAAGLTVERLHEQIATLTDQLTAAQTEVAELAITRKTLLSLGGRPTPHHLPTRPSPARPTSRSSPCSTTPPR